ncbi:MAG: hypothetical protein ACO3C1_11660 [Ilumatobacteraceae bacterium]
MNGVQSVPALPSTGRMFRRAVVLRCPQCGSHRSFVKRWLGRYERCRTCGIRWHREHGFELGPIALNVVVTFFILGVTMAVSCILTAPDIPVGPLTAALIGTAIVVPMLAQPFTYMLWLAFDLASRRPDAAELADAAAAVTASAEAGRRPA